MPALLPGLAGDGSGDRLGMKWVSGNPANNAAGLAGIYGLLLLNDPVTTRADRDPGRRADHRGADGGNQRRGDPGVRAAPSAGRRGRHSIGAGVQGRSHVPVLGYVLPGVELVVYDRDPGRAASLAALAAATEGIGSVSVAASARDGHRRSGRGGHARRRSWPPPERQVMTNDWLSPNALVVAVDYATYCAAEVARDADLFLVDHTAQFLANRDAGNFDGYPEPAAMIGEALARGTPRPSGRVVATHLARGWRT